jgi:hypothetical protein
MTKLTFKKMMLNEIENRPRGFLTEVAKFAGYPKGGNLTRTLENEKTEFDDFNRLIKTVQYIFPKEEVEIMVMYSKDVDPNKKTARVFLEYLSMHRKWEDFMELVGKMESCSNNDSKEYAKIYRRLYEYELATKEEIKDLLREIYSTNVNVYELQVFKKMLLNYCYSQLNSFGMVKELSTEIESDVELIDNDFIKEMYMVRSCQIMSYNNLRVFNNPVKAIECADTIINSNTSTTSFKAHAYFIKGYSYLFTSHEKAIENLNKSLHLYQEQNRTNDVEIMNEKIEFVNVYWDKVADGKCENVKNQLLFDIKQGKNVTDDLTSHKDKNYEAYFNYLEGLNTNSNKKLMLSLIKYKNNNDLFLANLAKIELLKNGEDEEILNEMIGGDSF